MSLSARVLVEETLESAQRREHDDLLRLIVSGSSAQQDLTQLSRLSPLNLIKQQECHVVVFDGEERPRIAEIVRRQVRNQGAAFVHDDHICALINPGVNAEASAKACLAQMRELGISATAGTVLTSLGDISREHGHALRIAKSLTSLGHVHEVSDPFRLGSVGLLLGQNPGSAEAIIRGNLGAALDYDRDHKSNLLQTALAYLDSDRNIARTAETLIVHENTVRQRLDRLRELLGAEWMSGTRALDSHLALRTWSLMSAGRSDSAKD